MKQSESIDYYKKQSEFSDPKEFRGLFEKLPNTIPELCDIVHGLIIHRDFLSGFYDLELTEKRKNEPQTRYVDQILKRIMELDDKPLIETRAPAKRFTGTCRDFAILLCSILRYQGTPARIRCGFGGYFRKGKYEDHWVCEYWNFSLNKWILVDAQVDENFKKYFNITFDVTDVPWDQFLAGGQAWIACRSGKLDPDNFGISIIDQKGIREVFGNACRDFASLNRIELLPWDDWEFSNRYNEKLTEEEIKLMNNIANATTPESDDFEGYRKLYQNEKLTVPNVIISQGDQLVTLRSSD